MYAWIYRHLPGPWWVRVLMLLLAAAAVIVVLFAWVFPAIAPFMPFNGNTVGDAG